MAAVPSIPTWLKLSAAHLAFLLAVSCYLAHFFPAEARLVWVFLGAGVVGELVSWWRRVLIAEGLLISVAIGIWLVAQPETREGWHAFLGMLMATWLLVPSRLGWLRWLVPLAALEVLYLSINAPSIAIGRSASRWLLPIAVCALAGDAWLVAISGARASSKSPPPRWSMAMWALLPALVAVAGGVWSGHELLRYEHPVVPNPRPGSSLPPLPKEHLPGLSTPALGEPGTVALDPVVCARVYFDEGEPPAGMFYLRSTALDLVVADGDQVLWQAPALEDLVPASTPLPVAGNACTVYRAASENDAILHPDDGLAVALDGLEGDVEGNLYRTAIGEGPRVYRCSLDDSPRKAPADLTRYLAINSRLRTYLPWQDIEAGQPWSGMRPEEAAQAIQGAIDQRCGYSLTIPPPMHGAGGALRTFLFDPDPAKRVGHCQYFATAEALLLRHSNHPARLIIGYASKEHDDKGVTFRAMDAHAWVEYVDSDGGWRRIDPTPPGPLDKIREEAARGEQLPPPPAYEPPPAASAPPTLLGAPVQAISRHGLLVPLAIGVALAAAALAWHLKRVRARPWQDPRRVALERRADDLFVFARSLGIEVQPASTVLSVSLALERSCGLDLGRWRDAHLAARYGTGPMPEPWPFAQMRTAAKARSAAVRA